MKTVFILGAGASREAGGPLMNDFLDKAWDLLRTKASGVVEVEEEFDDVFDAISELQGVHAKSYLDLDNIETLFGAIEMGLLLGRLGDRDKSSIEKLRKSLITMIYKTLEYSIRFPVQNGSVSLPKPYDRFMGVLAGVEKHQPRNDPHEFAFITFNYDLCLDYSLHRTNRFPDYCLTGEREPNTTPLLKLHGSINWGSSEKDGITPHKVDQVNFNPLPDEQYIHFDLWSTLSAEAHDKGTEKGSPVIVPPTWNKTDYQGQLSNVWTAAAHELSKAENIFIIGYSLPETDSFFRYLYALGSVGPSRIRNFVVINPDLGNLDSKQVREQIRKRFEQLIGRGIEKKFRPIGEPFAPSTHHIEYILTNP